MAFDSGKKKYSDYSFEYDRTNNGFDDRPTRRVYDSTVYRGPDNIRKLRYSRRSVFDNLSDIVGIIPWRIVITISLIFGAGFILYSYRREIESFFIQLLSYIIVFLVVLVVGRYLIFGRIGRRRRWWRMNINQSIFM